MRTALLTIMFSSVVVLSMVSISHESLCERKDSIHVQQNGIPWNWTVETVDDDTNVGIESTMLLGKGDLPIIVYQDFRYTRIKLAEKVGDYWNLEIVRPSAAGPSAALDSRERLHMAFVAADNSYNNYGIMENGSWKFETIPGSAGYGPESIALDSLDNPHIGAYFDGNVNHIYFDGTEWKIIEVEHKVESSFFGSISIEMDSESVLHMAYADAYGYVLKYASWNGMTWRVERVDDASPAFTSISVTSEGEPHILYRGIGGYLKHAYRVAGSWAKEELPFGHGDGSIAMDTLDRPHIVFSWHISPFLGYAFWDGTSWKSEAIDKAKNLGGQPSIAIDSKGYPHISYYDQQANHLIYVTVSKGPILADVDIDPDVLNLRSKGKWITAYVELGDGHDPRDIDASTIVLNGAISPVLDAKYGFARDESSYIVDHDSDGILERMVKFDRSKVIELLDSGDLVSLVIAGKLYDGTEFRGSDEIRVLDALQPVQCLVLGKHIISEHSMRPQHSVNVVHGNSLFLIRIPSLQSTPMNAMSCRT